MLIRWLVCLLTFVAPLAVAEEVALRIGEQTLHVEIADSPALRAQGLMGRSALCADCGMLFVFPHPDRHAFWMKDTPSALDIAFINAHGVIVEIQSMQPYSLKAHAPDKRVLYALETPQGWFAARKIRPGMRIESLAQIHTLH